MPAFVFQEYTITGLHVRRFYTSADFKAFLKTQYEGVGELEIDARGVTTIRALRCTNKEKIEVILKISKWADTAHTGKWLKANFYGEPASEFFAFCVDSPIPADGELP